MSNILEEVQQEVAARLSSSWQLSAVPFLVENRKDLDYEIKNRLGKQGIVGLVMTPKAQFAGKYEDLFLAWQIDELEVDVIENVPVNRGTSAYVTGQDAAMRVFDVLCPLSGDQEGAFCPSSYEEGEDSGLLVNRCVLKALVYGERGDTPSADPPVGMKFMKLLDAPPEGVQPRDVWAWLSGDQFFCCAGERVLPLGAAPSWVSSYVAEGLSAKADVSALAGKLDVSAYHGASIEDAGGCSISADRSFVTETRLPGVWDLHYDVTVNTLSGQSKTNVSYYPSEPELGDRAFQLTWGIHSEDYWTLEVFQWADGWSQSGQYDSEAALSSATNLSFPGSPVRSCEYREPTVVEAGRLASEEWTEREFSPGPTVTVTQDRSLYRSSAQVQVKAFPDSQASVVRTNEQGMTTGTFVASFQTRGWQPGARLSDAVEAPDSAYCYVFGPSGTSEQQWSAAKSVPLSSAGSVTLAFPY